MSDGTNDTATQGQLGGGQSGSTMTSMMPESVTDVKHVDTLQMDGDSAVTAIVPEAQVHSPRELCPDAGSRDSEGPANASSVGVSPLQGKPVRSSLAALFGKKGADELETAWSQTDAAEDFVPIESGTYACRILSGELDTAKTGTNSYKLTFLISDGEFKGRQLFQHLWLTKSALCYTKRELKKLGITKPEQLSAPLRPGILCRVRVVQKTGDDGTIRAVVKDFTPVGQVSADDDTFSPERLGGEVVQ